MTDIELNPDSLTLIVGATESAFEDRATLRTWLQRHLPQFLPDNLAVGDALGDQVTYLFVTWARPRGYLRDLLQRLANDPPRSGQHLPTLIWKVTDGAITGRRAALSGLPPVPPYHDWFVGGIRPFVNRRELRTHLEELGYCSAGAQCVMVIQGAGGTGKSWGVRMATACQSPDQRVHLDIKEYAEKGAQVDAATLASAILKTQNVVPPFDPTKEWEALPRLLRWLSDELAARSLWIIVDHCNSSALSAPALRLLRDLAEKIEQALLPNVRLILVDFDSSQLPVEWRNLIRLDQAKLPAREDVQEWCQTQAEAAKRQFAPQDLQQWVADVFANLEQPHEKHWYHEWENRLRNAHKRILQCPIRP